ncbi:hypothetical protein SLS62_003655 [Diatrype stigma]|uniref:Uncharacterized protein n=1 Tax=Diatrype stigma TaxID=117547 RepID=A0AAN9UW23_9PEZI
MYKTRLRKWGLFKYRTGSQTQKEICKSRSCAESNRAGSVTGNTTPESALCELHHQALASPRHAGCQGHWEQNTDLCVEFSDSTSGSISEDFRRGQRRRLATRMVPPISVPAVLRAPSDLQCLEEASRIANGYIQGSLESGAWTYDERLHGVFGHRGLAGWEDTFAWLGRLVEGISYIQCGGASAGAARTRDGFRMLNACLDETAARLRYQDATTMYYFLVFAKIPNRALRRALVRHVQELARVVLGSRHPFTLVFQRLAWCPVRKDSNDIKNNNNNENDNGNDEKEEDDDSESTATLGHFTEIIGVKHSFFDKPLRLCPAPRADADSDSGAGAGAAAAVAQQERYASTVVGADAGYAHVLAALGDGAKLAALSRTLRRTLWQNDNDPGEPVGSIIGFDLMLSVARGLRLHGERAEAALALETVRRWLGAMGPEVAGRRAKCYVRELKELKGVK